MPDGSIERREIVQVLGLSLFLAGRFEDAIPRLEAHARVGRDESRAGPRPRTGLHANRSSDQARQAFARTFNRRAEDSAAAHLVTAQMMIRLQLEDRPRTNSSAHWPRIRRSRRPTFCSDSLRCSAASSTRAITLTKRELAIEPGERHGASTSSATPTCVSRKWDDAIAALQQSLWLNPFYSGPYILLGKAYMQKGQPATAEGMLRRAIEYDPEQQVRALPARARCCSRPAATDEAKQEFEIAERLQGRARDWRRRADLRVIARLVCARRADRTAAQLRGPVTFTDVAERAGLRAAQHLRRRRSQALHHRDQRLPASAFVDYDNDGWLDALVLSGTRLERGTPRRSLADERERRPAASIATSTTARSRTSPPRPGSDDRVGVQRVRRRLRQRRLASISSSPTTAQNVLYRNRGRARFEDVTARAGLPTRRTRWGSGCSFVDYDRDGRLDLFVANYLRFDLATAPEPGRARTACGRASRSTADRRVCRPTPTCSITTTATARFADVSDASGIAQVTGRYPMTARRRRFRRRRLDRHLRRVATRRRRSSIATIATARSPTSRSQSGAAYSENGNPQAGMGVAVGDYNGDGRLDLLKTHFADDIPALYRNLGRACSKTSRRAAASPSRTATSNGAPGMPDLDNDGRPDVVLRHRQRVSRRSSARCRSIRTGARAWCSGTSAAARFDERDGAQRPAPPRRTRAAARPSATSTTTATSTCWS